MQRGMTVEQIDTHCALDQVEHANSSCHKRQGYYQREYDMGECNPMDLCLTFHRQAFTTAPLPPHKERDVKGNAEKRNARAIVDRVVPRISVDQCRVQASDLVISERCRKSRRCMGKQPVE